MSDQWMPKPGDEVLIRGTTIKLWVKKVYRDDNPPFPECSTRVLAADGLDHEYRGVDLPLCDYEPVPPPPPPRPTTPEERSLSRRKDALYHLGHDVVANLLEAEK